MKQLINLVNSIIIASWVTAIALFSIQNVQSVSLKFLSWQSIQMPIGLMLAFFLGFGFILAGLLPLLPSSRSR